MYSDILSGSLSSIYSEIPFGFYLTFYPAFYLTSLLTFYLAFYLKFYLTFYVTSCTRKRGPVARQFWRSPIRSAVPAAIWRSRLRSSSVHRDLKLAVEVRQELAPAVPTKLWSLWLKSGIAIWDVEFAHGLGSAHPDLLLEVQQCPLSSY